MPNLVVSAVAKWNGTALKKGEKQITGFQKATNLLAKAFVAAFAVQKITAFGKASVQAFAADEKAAKSLAITLQNTGNGFATIATEGFISRMQKTYKVLDDDLRPAFQTLLTATGDLSTSQSALELALDISAGTGKSLASVTAALAKGYAGNTTALSRLGAGLDKALIATGDMDKITGALSAKFKGQALGATKTYAGQMDALAVSSANVKETIGKGILDALAIFAGDGTAGIDSATAAMEDFAVTIADAIVGFGKLSKTIKDSFLGEILYKAFRGSAVALLLKRLGNYGKGGKEASETAAYSSTSMYFTAETAERAKLNKTIKTQNATEKEKQRLAAAKLAADKKAAELDELKKKFDVGRINLETALANSKDEAEKARLRSLLTIMDEDENSAAKRMKELDQANADKMKAELAAAAALKYLAAEADRAAKGLSSIGNPQGIYNYTKAAPSFTYDPPKPIAPPTPKAKEEPPVPDLSNMPGNPGGIYDYSPSNPSFTYSPPVVNNFTFNDAVGTSDNFAEAVKLAIQKVNRYGDSTTYAGALG
jgi:hypothetical protein